MKNGEFKPITDEETVKEIRLLIETLDGIGTTIVSDHILNLLEELEGKLPGDKERLLSIIDRYFSLPERDRLIYRLGRRRGLYRRLDDLAERYTYGRLNNLIEQYESRSPGQMDSDLAKIMNGYI
jgi:hypothetical protein